MGSARYWTSSSGVTAGATWPSMSFLSGAPANVRRRSAPAAMMKKPAAIDAACSRRNLGFGANFGWARRNACSTRFWKSGEGSTVSIFPSAPNARSNWASSFEHASHWSK